MSGGREPHTWWRNGFHSAFQPHAWGEEGTAAAWLLVGALSFSLMGVAVKAVGARLPVAEVVLARALVSVILSAWLVRRAGVDPRGHRPGLLLLRGLLGSLGLFCVFAALTRLPLAVATVIQYLNPLLTALLAWPLLGERPGRRMLPALLLGWLGVMLIVQPIPFEGMAAQASLPADGVMIALAGALLSALAYVSVRALGRSEHPQVIVLWFPLVSLPLSLPFVLLDPVLPTPVEMVWLVAVGLLTQLGQIGLTNGLLRLPAARATALGYSQVAFAALWGWWLYDERPEAGAVAGALAILGATLLTLSAKRRPAQPRPSPGSGSG